MSNIKRCEKCGGATAVINSRDEFGYVRRRRKCSSCGYRYSTVEIRKSDFDRVEKNVQTIKDMADDLHSFNSIFDNWEDD